MTITSAVGGATSFGIGCKYSLGKDSCVRAKVDNSSVVSSLLQYLLSKHPNRFLVSVTETGSKLRLHGSVAEPPLFWAAPVLAPRV